MKFIQTLASAAVLFSAGAAQSDENSVILGSTAFGAHCALCHGSDGKGGGEIAELFQVRPAELTKLSERAGGTFPYSDVYGILISGMGKKGHGDSKMPIWGDFFLSDALVDRGVNETDALYIAAGRAASVVDYLESIQE